jgi:hypothetical protein
VTNAVSSGPRSAWAVFDSNLMHGSTGNITLEGRTHPSVAGNSVEKVQMPPIVARHCGRTWWSIVHTSPPAACRSETGRRLSSGVQVLISSCDRNNYAF